MRDSDIDALSADGAQEPYPADSAEALLREALKVLRGMSDDLADGVLEGRQPWGIEDADWSAANDAFRAALQVSAPSPAAEQ